jgi:hypothetical protein
VNSATRGLERLAGRKHETFQIDEEHSNIVKFASMHDKNLLIAIAALARLLRDMPTNTANGSESGTQPKNTTQSADWIGPPTATLEPLTHPFKLSSESPNLPVRGPIFGREQELKDIAHNLHANSSHMPNILSVYGQPGIGKTQLIAHYIANHRGDYSDVFYLDATTVHSLRRTLQVEVDRLRLSWSASILLALSWSDAISANIDRFVSYLHEKGNIKWLLVVDQMHYDDASEVRRVIDRLATGTIILISTSSSIATRFPAVRIGPLASAASAKTIYHYAGASGIAITTGKLLSRLHNTHTEQYKVVTNRDGRC